MDAPARPGPGGFAGDGSNRPSAEDPPAITGPGGRFSGRRLDESGDGYRDVEYEAKSMFSFDLTKYSISYRRCASVEQYDADLASLEGTGTVLTREQFAVFRLCPTNTCDGKAGRSGGGGSFYALQGNGANGRECRSDYGEYLMELEEFLAVMAKHRINRLEGYCNACEACLYGAYENWLQQYQRRELENEEYGSRGEGLTREDAKKVDQRDLNYDPYEACPAYDACKNNHDTCQNGLEDSLANYLECAKVNGEDGSVYYIGPRCGSDGMSITFGAFYDEDCNQYAGNSVDIEDLLGFEVDDDMFAAYLTGSWDLGLEQSKNYDDDGYSDTNDLFGEYYASGDRICIPCAATQYSGEGGDGDGDGSGDGNGNERRLDQNENGGIKDFCENLYWSSVRCDRNVQGRGFNNRADEYPKFMAQEDFSCDFIESVASGRRDRAGQVVLGGNYAPDSEHWNDLRPALMGAGLIVSMLACVVLSAWSCSLRKTLRKRREFEIGLLDSRLRSSLGMLSEDLGGITGRIAAMNRWRRNSNVTLATSPSLDRKREAGWQEKHVGFQTEEGTSQGRSLDLDLSFTKQK